MKCSNNIFPANTYYIAYLSHNLRKVVPRKLEIIYCQSIQPKIGEKRAFKDVTDPTLIYGFGSNWELFELNDDEIINHIVAEII